MPRSRYSRNTLLRLGGVLALSLVIHFVLFGALPRLPIWQDAKDEPIVARLEMPAEPPVVLHPPTPIVPPPRVPLESRTTKMQPLTLPPIRTPPIVVASQNAAPSPPVISSTEAQSEPSPGAVGPLAAPGPTDASPNAATTPTRTQTTASTLPIPPAPPAAKPVDAILTYDVTALDPKNPNQSLIGHGTLGFHANGSSYRAELEARVTLLFVSLTVLASDSNGMVGSDGLEPERYSETPRGKPTSITSFARDPNGTSQVSYSQGGQPAAATPGTQDRLTVLLQIGALMQANASLKSAGARFSIPVAGLKGEVEPWNFAVQGIEPVRLDQGAQNGWHVARVLRPGTNDRGIDVWVGTESPYIPLRVRYTEPGGATIDLLLASSS